MSSSPFFRGERLMSKGFAVFQNVAVIDGSSLLTSRDVAAILRISVTALHVRMSRGHNLPPPIRLGRLLRWRRQAVQDWLSAMEGRVSAGENRA